MYVCICKAITEKQVKQAIKEGHSNLKDLSTKLGLGSQCGRCCPYVQDLVQNENHLQAMPTQTNTSTVAR